MVFVVLDSPLFSVFDGSELLGLGAALPGAVPGGVLVIGLMLLDELDGVDDDEVGLVVEDDGALDVPPYGLLDVLPELMLPELDEGVAVVEGLGAIEVSVVGVTGGSVLLQAPRTARVAASATHLIERRMFIPRN